ncbi:MAG: glycosyltransferase family 2 protein [Candidatus Omnitrophica bacterium]|nr:glycosyltransferase family 2 protein [Candidatus Omnitrophota bacterium]
MGDFRISVIIPAYNSEGYLAKAIQSVLDQKCLGLEIIVVDDGSTDNTRRVAESFNGQIRYFYKENGGTASARNVGIKQAQGEYLFFLDNDDLLGENVLEHAVELLERNKKFKVIYGKRSSFIDGHHIDPSKWDRAAMESGNIFPLIVKGLTLTPGQFMVSREVIENIGGFNEKELHPEDWEFLLRVSSKYEFLFMDKIFVYKRLHIKMKSFEKGREDLYQLRYRILKNIFSGEFDDIVHKHITPAIIADWHRSHGFSYGESGDRQTEREYLIKSLKVWPFQPKLWLWFAVKIVKNRLLISFVI